MKKSLAVFLFLYSMPVAFEVLYGYQIAWYATVLATFYLFGVIFISLDILLSKKQ